MDSIPHTQKHTLVLEVNTKDTKAKFDRYWNSVKDRLNPELVAKATKGGFRDLKRSRVVKLAGGDSYFFRQPLIEIVNDHASANNKNILMHSTILFENGKDTSKIIADVYYEPEVKWSNPDSIPGTKEPLKVQINAKSSRNDLIERVFGDEITSILDKNSTTTPFDGAVFLGSVVKLNVETKIDGQVDNNRTGTNISWLVEKGQFSEPEMADNLVGMKVGESKTFDLTLVSPDVAGKKANIGVTINEVLTRSVPTLDDVAKAYGSTADEIKAKIREMVIKNIDIARNEAIMAKVMVKFIESGVTVEAPPDAWIMNKSMSIYNINRDKVETEEDLFNVFSKLMPTSSGPINKNAVLGYISNQVVRDLNNDLILKSWGTKMGLSLPDNRRITINDIGDFANVVRNHILSTAIVEEIVGGNNATV